MLNKKFHFTIFGIIIEISIGFLMIFSLINWLLIYPIDRENSIGKIMITIFFISMFALFLVMYLIKKRPSKQTGTLKLDARSSRA